MMACKCDRCEALFVHEPKTVHLDYSITESVASDGAPTQQGYEVDLCPKCSEQLLNWVKHDS